jgi:hypothetical protein
MRRSAKHGSIMDAIDAFYRDSTLPVDQRRMAAVSETRRLLHESLRQLKSVRNAVVHTYTGPESLGPIVSEALAVHGENQFAIDQLPSGNPEAIEYQAIVAFLEAYNVGWSKPVGLRYSLIGTIDFRMAPPAHLHALFYQVLRTALRRANTQFRLLLRAFERPQRLHEFVARQRSWHLLHGARPPRPLVSFLRPMNVPGAPA